MAFCHALEKFVGFGLFNKTLLTAIIILQTWHETLSYFGHLFALLTPDNQWCINNQSEWKTFNESTMKPGACQFLEQSKDSENVTVIVDKESTCDSGWIYDDSIFLTATMEKAWLCGESNQLYIIHTCHWVGSIVGFLISGFLADRFGRKKTVCGLLLMTILSNLGSVLFTDHTAFSVFRFFSGAGTYTASTSCFILVMEYTIASKRTLVGFIWGLNWTLAGTAYPWYASYISSWRGLFITTAAVEAVLLFVFWWAPESSSWLLSVGKKKEATVILLRIAKINGNVVTEDQMESFLCQKGEDDSEISCARDTKGFWRTTLALVETPRIRRNTLLILPIWCMMTMCYYVGSLHLGRLGLDVYATYSVTSAFELPMNIICILVLDRLGRRWPNFMFMLIGGVVSIIMVIVKTDSDAWTLVMAVTFMTCFSGGFNITCQIGAEIFPTVIRARAVLLQHLMSDIGSVLGTPVAATVEWDQYLPVLVCGILALITAMMLPFLPETVGLPLPQTITDGENLGKDRGFCFCPCIPTKETREQMGKEEHTMSMLTGHHDPIVQRRV
ncbi:solute carrier family 22 member 13-like [Ornithodoros turicata]|uniref:solute carrier family 22 member 13-like n=1 Tax=Ornithodoros turicata TaxID=34597 RepID=UPI00313A1A32